MAASGWFTSCAIDVVSSPSAVMRLACASSDCARRSAASASRAAVTSIRARSARRADTSPTACDTACTYLMDPSGITRRMSNGSSGSSPVRRLDPTSRQPDVVRMNPLHQEFERRLGQRIIPEDAGAFGRPEHRARSGVVANAAGMGQLLRFRQQSFAAAQGVLGPLEVLDIGGGLISFDDLPARVPQAQVADRNHRYSPSMRRRRASTS